MRGAARQAQVSFHYLSFDHVYATRHVIFTLPARRAVSACVLRSRTAALRANQ